LREEGYLDELKTRWWFDRSECGGNAGSSVNKELFFEKAFILKLKCNLYLFFFLQGCQAKLFEFN
jgi:hypothetical protein